MSLPAHFIDVRSCGAAGDGVTDDTVAIQTALTQLTQSPAPGMAVFFPPGIYKVGAPAAGNNYLLVQNATDFEIRSYGATIQNASGEANNSQAYDTLKLSNCQRFKISGLTIDGNKSNRGGGNDSGPHTLYMAKCSDFVIRDCFLLNACGDTLYMESSDGTAANGVHDGLIDGRLMDGASRNAISLINGARLKIVNNTIRNVSGAPSGPGCGIDFEPNVGSDVVPALNDIIVANNSFANCIGGAVLVNATEQLSYVTIDGNEVIACSNMFSVGGWHCRVSNNIGRDIIRPTSGLGSSSAAAILVEPSLATGTGATATAVLGGGVTDAAISNPGTGYSSSFAVSFTGGGGSGAAGTATASGGVIQSVSITSPGSGYTSAPTANFSAGGGTGAAGLGGLPVASVTITAGGSGYSQNVPPFVTFTSSNVGSGATGATTVSGGGAVTGVTLSNSGLGYTAAPNVDFTAEHQVLVDNNKIFNIAGGQHGIEIHSNMRGVAQVIGNQIRTIRGENTAAIVSYANFTQIADNLIEDGNSFGISANDGTTGVVIVGNRLRNSAATLRAGLNQIAIYVGGANGIVRYNDILDWGGTTGSIFLQFSGGYNLVDGNLVRASTLQSTWKSLVLGTNDVKGPTNYSAFTSDNNLQKPAVL